jgi:hypothetical protein
MYIFKIKDNSAVLDVAILRTLFLAAAVATIFFNNNVSPAARYIPAVVLIILLLFTKVFLLARKVSKYVVLLIGATVLFIALHSFTAMILFFLAGLLPRLFYKAPEVLVDKEAVVLKRMIGSKSYSWNEFNNIILKDNLLTLDFNNNKVLQLEVDGGSTINEKEFNGFCSGNLAHGS